MSFACVQLLFRPGADCQKVEAEVIMMWAKVDNKITCIQEIHRQWFSQTCCCTKYGCTASWSLALKINNINELINNKSANNGSIFSISFIVDCLHSANPQTKMSTCFQNISVLLHLTPCEMFCLTSCAVFYKMMLMNTVFCLKVIPGE